MNFRPHILGLMLATSVPALQAAPELMVYSTKNQTYLTPLFDRYSAETGTPISYLIEPASALISRLEAEGEESKADLILLSSAASLWQASEKGLTASIDSSTLNKNIPEHLRSPKNDWFGFSKRTQTLIYNSTVLDADQLSSYSDLADPKWEGSLCLRTSQQPYTQSLVAMMIERDGEAKTLATLQGWVYNQAVRPFAEDAQIFPAMEQNLCDVSIVNGYYFARYQHENPNTPLKIFWADQDSQGVHVDVTGAAVTAHASNKAGATDFLEWLTLKETQSQYANLSLEYPVNKKVYPARMVARRGKYTENQHNVAGSGRYQQQAIALLKQAGYR